MLDDDEDLAVDATDDDEDNNNNNDDDNDNDNDSTGASTTNETLSVETRSRITDFTLLCWFKVNPDEAVVINHEFIPALIEVKRSPSQESTGEELAEAQKGLLLHAKEDVYRQALYLFANPRWSHQKSVVVIAAAGDLWSYTTLSRDDHLAQTARANDTDPDWEPNTLDINAFQWSEIAVWGREGEDAKRVDEVINQIRDCVR